MDTLIITIVMTVVTTNTDTAKLYRALMAVNTSPPITLMVILLSAYHVSVTA